MCIKAVLKKIPTKEEEELNRAMRYLLLKSGKTSNK